MPPWRERDEISVLTSKLNSPHTAQTDPTDENLGWTAAEIAAASGELLAHFNRSGMRFLPQSNPSAVAQWAESFAPLAADTSGSESAANQELAQTPSQETPPASAPPLPASPEPARSNPPGPRVESEVSQAYSGTALPIAERASELESLAQRVAGCTRCQALASCRTQTVFGEGPPNPRFVFFGEGPGAEEDKSGRPFVGQAGQLLTKMIEAIHLSREEVYLLNTVKCRPPGNRNPDPDEIENCREYFEMQLNLLRPEYIVCLGAIGSQALLRSKLSIGRLRQRFHQYHDSKVLAIYHPAYLLRNPNAKKAAWADLQMLMKDAGL